MRVCFRQDDSRRRQGCFGQRRSELIAQGDGEGGGEASGCDADAAAGVFRENMLGVMCGYYMPVTVDKLAHRGVDRAG
jgi:hypothetical protein